ncbi:MAG: ATP-binding protein [Defluviitaleaceae bacterium]|nr:ATP-binding protein [Defluviitaleaceae bacterium]MCL2275722.1 ATP-binding protein [Defluviitaleaceae bacterium]
MMMLIFIGVAGLAVGTLVVFALRRYLAYLADRRIAAYQQDLMLKHYAEVQNMYNQVRGWRHDYHSHLQVMKAFLTLGQREAHEAYLTKLDADLTGVDTILRTGNVMMDAILNSKISLALAKEIQVNAKATVPETLTISEVDLAVIIGNLLDNAMEANALLPKAERFIRLYIGKHKEMFYISVSNAMGTLPQRQGLQLLSTKKDPDHGFGLKRIDRIVDKNNGFVNRQFEDGIFATEIMLPL